MKIVFSSGEEFGEKSSPCLGTVCNFLGWFMEMLPEIKDVLKLSNHVDYHAVQS